MKKKPSIINGWKWTNLLFSIFSIFYLFFPIFTGWIICFFNSVFYLLYQVIISRFPIPKFGFQGTYGQKDQTSFWASSSWLSHKSPYRCQYFDIRGCFFVLFSSQYFSWFLEHFLSKESALWVELSNAVLSQ